MSSKGAYPFGLSTFGPSIVELDKLNSMREAHSRSRQSGDNDASASDNDNARATNVADVNQNETMCGSELWASV